jgi:phospholipase/carboxylesterase
MNNHTLKTELYPAQDTKSRRTLVVLHGLGDSIEGYRWLPEALQLPYLNYILVNAPDDYNPGYSWFNIDTQTLIADPKTVARSRALLFKLFEHLHNENYPPEQMMVLGFSQGCLMTWEVGVRYPRRLAGLIGISGWALEKDGIYDSITEVSKQQRFLITHGLQDPYISAEKVGEQIQKFKSKGLNIEYRVFNKEHTILAEEEIPLFRKFINKVLIEEPVNANVNCCNCKQK